MAFTETADGVLSHEELDGLVGRGSTLLQARYLKTLWPVLRPAYKKSFATWFEHRYDLTSN